VTRIEDIGAEARRAMGTPPSGPGDRAFLAALSGRRRRAAWGRIALLYGLTAAAATVLLATRAPVPSAVPPVEMVEDPMAAILLESAELRLEGFGDAAEAPVRLREVVRLYPDSRSAVRAGELLSKIEGRRR
jgi:hypothetical protein